MEMEKQIYNSSKLPNYPSHLLSMHKNSQTISKSKPKIRIIHIFAPEIIKTDVANFRELVQRLTGKPTDEDGCRNTKKKKKRTRDAELRERIKGEEEIWSGANSGGGFLGGFGDQLEFGGLLQEININGNNNNNNNNIHFPFLEGTTQIMDAYGETVQFVAN